MAGRLINPLVYIIFMGSYKRVRYFKLFINLYERSKKCLRLLSVALWFEGYTYCCRSLKVGSIETGISHYVAF